MGKSCLNPYWSGHNLKYEDDRERHPQTRYCKPYYYSLVGERIGLAGLHDSGEREYENRPKQVGALCAVY